MLPPPVVAVPPFQYKSSALGMTVRTPACHSSQGSPYLVMLGALAVLWWCGVFAASSAAQPVSGVNAGVPGYVARIEQDDPQAVERALRKAEQYYLDSGMNPALSAITFILHGPEVEIFSRANYVRYKPIVDLAVRLSAFNRV